MNRHLTIAFATLLGLSLSNGPVRAQSHSPRDTVPSLRTMTPKDWSQMAQHAPRCAISTEPSGDGALARFSWHVDSLEGTILLPSTFKLNPKSGSTGHGYQWLGPDSSSITLDGIWALGGLAVSGGVVHGVSTCAAQLFGEKVPAHEFALIRRERGDTIYISTPGVIVRTGQGLHAMIQAHSAERRAKILEYVESLELARK